MKLSKGIFVYLLALISFCASLKSALAHKRHTCSHDKDDLIQKAQQKMQEYMQENPYKPTADDEVRKLAATTTQPIRVTTNMSGLSAAGSITATQTKYLTAIANTVVNFVSYFIKVQPNPANNIFDPTQTSDGTCITAVPLASDKSTGIASSDLHLYFIYENDATASFLANAGFCNLQQTSTYLRPNFGRVLFNIGQMTQAYSNFDQFENDVMVTLHEIIHVLGFSYGAMPNWYNKATLTTYGNTFYSTYINTLTLRSISTNLISTPNVLATAKAYYGCSTLTGMQLENQGGSGSINSHWERTVIRSEILTASDLAEGLNLTFFTVALLKDTGFWDDVNENLTDPIYWGKGKGCDFFSKACTSSTSYEEFSTNSASGCSFWNDAQGVGSNSDTFGDGCYFVEPYSNRLCDNAAVGSMTTSPTSYNSDLLNTYSYNSKCFVSSITNPNAVYSYTGEALRCLQSQCSSDYSTITITLPQLSNASVTCTSANAGTSINVTYSGSTIGQVTCPSNYQRFCDHQLCVNYCSYNGICIKGQCLCNPGFAGVDCSVTCATVVDSTGTCVSSCASGTYAGRNNVCSSTCPNGTYASSGVCQQCDFSCSACNGPLSTNCTACQFLTYLNGNTCATTCPTGTYANTTTKICTTCPTGCTNCTSGTVCGGCNTGFSMSGTLCASTSCTSPCASCTSSPTACLSCLQTTTLYLSGNSCVGSCPSNTFADTSNMTCTACSTGCTTCTSSTSCSVCNTAAGYRLLGSSCTLCTSPCATCSATNTSSCNSCENAKYLLNNTCYATCPSGYYNGASYQCSPCITGCSSCTNAVSCTTCNTASGYQAYTLNSQQICINASTCYTPCSTCVGTYQPTTCATCASSFYLQGATCKSTCDTGYFKNTSNQTCTQCSSTCTTCSNTATNCTSCPSPYFAYSGQCVTVCPTGYQASSGTCVLIATTHGIMVQLSLLLIALLFSLI